MATTESDDDVGLFEGWLERITNRKFGNDRQWCVLLGQSLAFYKNKRSSCLYCIELSKTKSVTSTEAEQQFVVKTTDKKYIYGTDSKELCDEWVKHISTALQSISLGVLNGDEKKLEISDHRRGSLPQQNTVKDAVKKHTSLYKKPSVSESVHKQRPLSTSKLVLDKSLSIGSSTDNNVEVVNIRPKSMGSKVKNLALRFSAEPGQVPMPVPSVKSPTSPSWSGYQKIKHTHEPSSVEDQKKETPLSNVHKRNSDNLKEKEERPDSGYSTLPDVADEKISHDTPSQSVQNEEDKVVIQANAVNTDDNGVQEEITKMENKAVLDTKPRDCNCTNAEHPEELENPVVMRRKTSNSSNMDSFNKEDMNSVSNNVIGTKSSAVDQQDEASVPSAYEDQNPVVMRRKTSNHSNMDNLNKEDLNNVSNNVNGTKSSVVDQQDEASVPSASEEDEASVMSASEENPVVMRRKTCNNADMNNASNTRSDAKDLQDENDDQVVMRRPSVPSAPVVVSLEEADDSNEQNTEDGDGVAMEDIFDMKFDELDENLPHSKSETHSSVTALKTLLLEIGGTDLDGTFVRKSVDVNDLKPVQQLSDLLQKLNM